MFRQVENGKMIGAVISFNDVTERKKMIESLVNLSYQDNLTTLYNRRYYDKEIVNVDQPYNLPISIVIGDINGLKLVNDAFGHEAGDEMLTITAQTMRRIVHNKGLVARIGGDEFVIVLPRTSFNEAEKITSQIEAKLQDYDINSIKLSISFGVATKVKENEDIREISKIAEDEMYREKLHRIPSMRSDAIRTILQTLNEKDEYSEAHSRNVSEISGKIATAMKLPKQQVQHIRTAALLHDIGKIILPLSIVKKPGKLTNDEYEEVKKHPEIGFRILNSSQNMRVISNFVLAHHERCDGTGYPRNLLKEEIPLESRIICVADAFDAMTTDRTYKDKMSIEEAKNELLACAGTQFDEKVVKVFLETI